MKNRLAFIGLLLGLSVVAFGQKFQGGVFAGLNASQVDNDGFAGYKKLGLNAGVFVGRELDYGLAWKMELKYTSRGMYQPPTLNNPSELAYSNLQYFEVPLSISYLYNEKVEVELGIAPDVLLREKYENESGILDPSYASDIRRFGLNVFGGINYYFIDNMAVGVRYTISGLPFYVFDYWTPRYISSGFFHDVLSMSVKYYFLR